MTEYALYLESGPRHRKTMVHVPALLGCIANGPTTEDALAATPDAIRGFLRFLRTIDEPGEPADPDAPFTTAVAEHLTQGEWMGNGSGSIVFATDLAPPTAEEIALYLRRFHAMRERWRPGRRRSPTPPSTPGPRTGGPPAPSCCTSSKYPAPTSRRRWAVRPASLGCRDRWSAASCR